MSPINLVEKFYSLSFNYVLNSIRWEIRGQLLLSNMASLLLLEIVKRNPENNYLAFSENLPD